VNEPLSVIFWSWWWKIVFSNYRETIVNPGRSGSANDLSVFNTLLRRHDAIYVENVRYGFDRKRDTDRLICKFEGLSVHCLSNKNLNNELKWRQMENETHCPYEGYEMF